MASKKVIQDVRENGGWDGIEYSEYKVDKMEEGHKTRRIGVHSDTGRTKIVADELDRKFEQIFIENNWINLIMRNEDMAKVMDVLNEITAQYGLKPRHNLKSLLEFTRFEKVAYNSHNFIIRYRENVEKDVEKGETE